MADVMQKAINANDIKLGGAVIKTQRNIQKLDTTPGTVTVRTVAQVEARYDNRMDKVRYYSGDTSS